MAARGRRESALASKRSAKPSDTGALGPSKRKRKSAAPKKLNLSTYKYHALGDYPEQIASFGTTDNTSTQTVRVLLNNMQTCSISDFDTGRTAA
jgi:hypothetical protein